MHLTLESVDTPGILNGYTQGSTNPSQTKCSNQNKKQKKAISVSPTFISLQSIGDKKSDALVCTCYWDGFI